MNSVNSRKNIVIWVVHYGFLRYKRFLDARDSFRDDMREGRSSFRDCSATKNELRDVFDSERRLTVIEIAEKCGISKTSIHEILSHDPYMNYV